MKTRRCFALLLLALMLVLTGCAAEKVVLLRRERHIAEACELSRVKAAPLQRACHREVADGFGQVHKPATLGDAGKTAGDSFANRFAHGFVLRERFGVELGVAARKIEPLKKRLSAGYLATVRT